MAKAENSRKAYRAAVCAWCGKRDRPALPAADVAAFLAAERRRGTSASTIDLRRDPLFAPRRHLPGAD